MKNFLSVVITSTIIVLFCVSFTSCAPDKKYVYSFAPLRTIDFTIGFNTWDANCENIDSIEYISFADFRTNQKIILSTVSGINPEMIIIPLDSFLNKGFQITSYEIINRDTLLLVEDYARRVFHLDFNGKLIKVYDFNEACAAPVSFDLYSSRMGVGSEGKGDLIFHCMFNSYNDLTGNNYRNNMELLINEQRKSPYFFRVNDLFSDSITYDFGLDNFYARFTNSSDLFFESPHYLLNDSLIYVFSNYSDTLYVLDALDLKIKQLHQIKSDYSEIGYQPATLEGRKLDPNLVNDLGRAKGFIQQIEIDQHKGLVYVLVLHEMLEASSDIRRIKPWSILIYDMSFQKLGEVKMDEKKYGSFMISTKEGLLISNAPTKQNDTDFYEKTTFELFEVVKN